jgi:hypothetical protein
MKVQSLGVLTWVLVAVAAMAGSARSQEKADTIRVFYFGNSLTGSSMPGFHQELGASAGKRWECDVFAGAGWQSWQHRNELWRAMGRSVDSETQRASSRGDLTLDEDLAASAAFKPKAFFEGEWDAIVIQIFGSRLNHVTDKMWGSEVRRPGRRR